MLLEVHPLPVTNVPFGVTYEKIGTIQRRLAWPLHKDDTLSRSGRPTGLNIYALFASRCAYSTNALAVHHDDHHLLPSRHDACLGQRRADPSRPPRLDELPRTFPLQ